MEVEPVKIKVQPPKKERSEKQKEATKKMLGILKDRRESHKKAQEEEATTEVVEAEVAVQQMPPKVKTKKLPPAPEYITKSHLEKFKSELLSSMPVPGERIVDRPVEKIVEKPIDRIVERPIEKIVEREKLVHLSGNALLDKIFFNR